MHEPTNRPFSLLIKPASADCNLACDYCFYLDHHSMFPESRIHRMSLDTLEAMTRTYLQTSQPQYVFAWQGGEPTCMGLDFFRHATALQTRHAPPHATLCNGLQTNATLIDDAMAAHFAAYRFLLGVSLDGPPAMHDTYRKTRGGEGSHALVLRGIEHLHHHAVEFNILVLVSKANVAHAREVYTYLCEQGFLHHQYIPCVEFAPDGTPLPYTITGADWGAFLCGLYDAWRPGDTRRVSIRLFDSLVEYFVNGRRNTCSMGRDCRQYFVVEHDGGVYPCDFYVHPGWKLGEVGRDDWTTLQGSGLYQRFGRRKARWHRTCEACAYLPVCAGDCLKNRLRRDPDPVEGDPRQRSWLCEGWKMFYAHALDGLRTLAGEVLASHPPAAYPAPPSPGADRAALSGAGTPPVRPPAAKSGRPSSTVTNPDAPPPPNAPCPCGSGRKFKRCCGRTP